MNITLSIPDRSKFKSAQRYFELIQVLVARNLKARYRGSFLGVYWSLFNPLIMTSLYTAIFGKAFASYYNNSYFHYMLAAFTGLVVIHFFSGSTSQALCSIVENEALLNKIPLPIHVFPVSIIVANVVQLAISILPILTIITLINSKSLINVVVLFFPITALILVSMGVGFFLSTLYVFFRDLPYLYDLTIFILWISSPIFYPTDIVPESVKKFLILNPLMPIIVSIRQICLSDAPQNSFLILQSLIGGLIILGLGWTCFRCLQSQFMDLL